MNDFNEYDERELDWIADVLVGAAACDNNISEEELIFMAKALDFLNDKKKQLALVDKLRSKKVGKIKLIEIKDNKKAVSILFACMRLMATDRQLKKVEIRYFGELAQRLGFEKSYIEELLQWGKDYSQIKAKEKELFTKGLSLNRC